MKNEFVKKRQQRKAGQKSHRCQNAAMHQKPTDTAATIARKAAGLTVAQAARKVGVCSGYLRQAEKYGSSYGLARRLAALLQCDISLFLWSGAVGRSGISGRGRTLPEVSNTEEAHLLSQQPRAPSRNDVPTSSGTQQHASQSISHSFREVKP